jgi:4-amino-4-deoxy-L-arabinose transferase-like glycosyltransferase
MSVIVTESSAQNKRREIIMVLLFVALALLLRFGLSQLDRVIKWDESDYVMLGRNLWAGRAFTTAGYPELHYPPLFPVLLGLTYALTRQPEWASNIWYILCGALLLLPYYALARASYGRRVALMSLALLSVFPALGVSVLYWGTMSEPLYLLLIYSGLYFLWQALARERLADYALGGLMFALAYLARPEGIVYFGLFGLLIVLYLLVQKRPLRQWRGLALYGVVFLLCALPYILYLHQHTGQWTFSGKVGVTFALGEAVLEKDPAAYDRATASLDASGQNLIWFSPERFRGSGMLSQVLNDPISFLRRIWANVRLWRGLFFARAAFPAFLLILIFLAWCKSPWTRERAGKELFWVAALLPPFAFLTLHIELRFFAPIFPALLLWVAKGADDLGEWWCETVQGWDLPLFSKPGWAVVWRILPLAALLCFFVAMQPAAIRVGQTGTDFGNKRVGLWLQANVEPEARVMSRDVAVAVYADRAWAPSPHADYVAYLRYARYHKADYLVVSRWEATVLRPQLASLLDAANPPPEVELVHREGGAQGETLVYRLR